MSTQTFPPLSAGPDSAFTGDPHGTLAGLLHRQPAVMSVPIALAAFSLLIVTIFVTNTGEQFSLDD